MALFDRSFSGNQAVILARKMMYESQQYHLWGKWSKFNTPDAKSVNPNKGTIATQVSNAPVVVHKELQKKQGDRLEVPMLRLLTQSPTFGLDQLKDREERQQINHASCYVDIVRHAVEPQEGIMSRQTTKDYRLIEVAKPQLSRHYAEVSNYMLASHALYNGYSKNVLDSARYANDANVSANSHPHIFIAGNGKVGYGVADYPGTSAYETAIGTAVTGVGASDVFDTNLLQALSADETVRYIRPLLMKDGNPFRIMVVHPYQLDSLKADSNFREVTSRAAAQEFAKKNPLLTGCQFFWDGWAIFDGGQAVFPVSVSGGDPVWGPSTVANLTSYQSYASYDKFGAMIVGDNALFRGIANMMEFKRRVDDYDEIKGVAYRTVEGYSRGDFWNEDDGTRGQYLVNEGSAIVVTAAAKPTL